MGNQPCRVAIRLDEPNRTFIAGDVISGRVCFAASESEELKHCQGIHLVLEGHERVNIPSVNNGNEYHYSYDRRVHDNGDLFEHSEHALIRTDYPIVQFRGNLKAGQYEYPFRFRLPADLPSSMRCQQDRSTAEIRYTLSVYVDCRSTGAISFRAIDNVTRDSMVIRIATKNPDNTHAERIRVPTKLYPIHTCGLWSRGSIELGWQAESDVAYPNRTFAVSVSGENQSVVKVKKLSVKIIESVDFSTRQSHLEHTVKRTLSEEEHVVASFPWWDPQYNGLQGKQHRFLLKIPSNARDSYWGDLIQVHHYVLVSVKTAGWATTTPESAYPIRITHSAESENLPSTEESQQEPVPHSSKETADHTAKAELLPPNWNPTVAEHVTVIPETSVLVVDVHAGEYSTSPKKRTTTTTSSSTRDTATTTSVKSLQSIVQAHPETLPDLLNDADWVAVIQNLTPREYSATIQCAAAGSGRRQGSVVVAQRLAQIMGDRLLARHVIACIYGISDATLRMQVLQQIAPLASDLQANLASIEQELTADELVHFRAAIA